MANPSKPEQFIVFSNNLCDFLLDNGLMYVEKKRDRRNPKYFVFIFDKTARFKQLLEQYMSRSK